MSSTILERARAAHEEMELCEQAAVEAMDRRPNGQKAKTWQQHEISLLVDRVTEASKTLLDIYEDKEGISQEELHHMKGKNTLNQFYEALKATNEYHHRFPNLDLPDPDSIAHVDIDVPFSGEEIYGKYLDLHELHDVFCNLPGQSLIEYTTYLEVFYELDRINEDHKTRQYRRYVNDLWEYLKGFLLRTQPLTDMNDIERSMEESFEADWQQGKVPGWENSASGIYDARPLDLNKFRKASELETLGADRLRSALEALGLKCGGTLKERAERLMAVKGKQPHEIDPKLFAKKKNGQAQKANGDNGNTGEVQSDKKQLALQEYKIRSLCEQMADVIHNTRRHVEKQQTRTVEEKEAEIWEEEQGLLPDLQEEEEEEEDEEGPLYNPLNLPLGWDGKPIPYWLYKLHGLGIEYKCEICGNQSYWGRRAFDRHFQEWRHAHGMRCLGIPNTKHFHDITLIEDAVSLYNKIRDQVRQEQFVLDDEEEFEDTEGNVLNKRTYEDLARQGLL